MFEHYTLDKEPNYNLFIIVWFHHCFIRKQRGHTVQCSMWPVIHKGVGTLLKKCVKIMKMDMPLVQNQGN